MVSSEPLLKAKELCKSFTLHTQAGIRLSVLEGLSLDVMRGECIASGASGSGKSTFMRCLYGNYRVDSGAVLVKDGQEWVDLTAGCALVGIFHDDEVRTRVCTRELTFAGES